MKKALKSMNVAVFLVLLGLLVLVSGCERNIGYETNNGNGLANGYGTNNDSGGDDTDGRRNRIVIGEPITIATARMIEDASKVDANAVVNIRYETASVMDGAVECIAYGTAVKYR